MIIQTSFISYSKLCRFYPHLNGVLTALSVGGLGIGLYGSGKTHLTKSPDSLQIVSGPVRPGFVTLDNLLFSKTVSPIFFQNLPGFTWHGHLSWNLSPVPFPPPYIFHDLIVYHLCCLFPPGMWKQGCHIHTSNDLFSQPVLTPFHLILPGVLLLSLNSLIISLLLMTSIKSLAWSARDWRRLPRRLFSWTSKHVFKLQTCIVFICSLFYWFSPVAVFFLHFYPGSQITTIYLPWCLQSNSRQFVDVHDSLYSEFDFHTSSSPPCL